MPDQLAGVGEKQDALEEFDPARLAGRILDMGDVVALLKKRQRRLRPKKPSAWPAVWQKASLI